MISRPKQGSPSVGELWFYTKTGTFYGYVIIIDSYEKYQSQGYQTVEVECLTNNGTLENLSIAWLVQG